MMRISIEIRGLEEYQHPFYIIRYAVIEGDKEVLVSAARYVHTSQGGKVQFLEPDLKQMQKLANGMEQVNEVERVILAEGARLVADVGGK
jgi:hypothetical protein